MTDFTGLTDFTARVELEITWRDAAFNSPTGRDVRFAGLTKTPLGWKIDGLGTGP